MLSLTFIIVFIFCFAIAVASILVSHQFITTYNTEFHRNYFYYLVAFFAFAFYGIWGQILMRLLLSSIDTGGEVVETVANFLPVLGVPFLFISWIMLVKMAYSLVDESPKKSIPIIHFGLFVVFITAVWALFAFLDEGGFLFGVQLAYVEIGLLIFIELVYMILFVGIYLHYAKKHNRPNRKIINRFMLLICAGLILRGVVLPFSFTSQWILAPLILIYFFSNFPPLFYLKLNADLAFTPMHAENPSEEKMAFIFKKYRITKREKEIVEQICQGKTNQQIADELFISLQTVKDHTHRIYSKIGINSRMNLVQMVNA